jgi:hypothetical protein
MTEEQTRYLAERLTQIVREWWSPTPESEETKRGITPTSKLVRFPDKRLAFANHDPSLK